MKKIKNSNSLKLVVIFIMIMGIIFINSYVIAATTDIGLGDLENYAKQQTVSAKFTTKVGTILGVVQMIGSLLSVICLIVLGVKYMMGSIEEKASYKKTLVPYVIGAIMTLGISNLLSIIYQIMQSF